MRSWSPVLALVALIAVGLFVPFDDWGIVNWILIFGAILGAAALGIHWKRSP